MVCARLKKLLSVRVFAIKLFRQRARLLLKANWWANKRRLADTHSLIPS